MQLKIITFNIWDLPFWFTREDPKRIEKIGAYLSEHGADFICLQESFDIEHRQWLHHMLGKQAYNVAGEMEQTRNILFIKRFDTSGGLVTFSKFPILSSRFVKFSRLYNLSVIEFFGRKGFLETIVDTPKGPLRVINLHLRQGTLPLDRWFRLHQLREIFKSLKNENEQLPTILVGDFNQDKMMHKRREPTILKRWGFIDPSELLADRSLVTFRPENNYVSNGFDKGKLAQRLDYILCKNIALLDMNVREYHPIYLSKPLSDHDPTILILSTERTVSEKTNKA